MRDLDAPLLPIVVDSVHKAFTQGRIVTSILEDISFEIHPGEMVAIFGPNGVGKTTLLNLMAGIITPDQGDIRPAAGLMRVGYIFQAYDRSLLPWLTCLDNIALPLVTGPSMSRKERRRQAHKLLDELGVSLPFNRYPYQLSGGQAQLTCLARALIIRPTFLLMDEPFASLDYLTRFSLMLTVQRLWLSAKVPAVFVSHDIEEAIFLSDRIIVITGKPARVVLNIEVPLPRLRDSTVFSSQAFLAVREQILSRFSLEEAA